MEPFCFLFFNVNYPVVNENVFFEFINLFGSSALNTENLRFSSLTLVIFITMIKRIIFAGSEKMLVSIPIHFASIYLCIGMKKKK